MYYHTKKINYNKFDVFFIVYTLLIFTFVTNTNGTIFDKPKVFYFSGLPVFFVVPITILICFFIILKKNRISTYDNAIKINLLLRCIICIIPLLYMTYDPSFSAHYPVVIYSFCVYYIASNFERKSLTYIYLILFAFILILEVQVICTYFLIDVDFLNLAYKNEMNIPIGGSNIIACFICPVFWLLYFNLKVGNKFRIIFLVLTLVALILTKSRGGLLVFLSVLIIYKLFLVKNIRLLHSIFFLLLIATILFYLFSIHEVDTFFRGYNIDNNNLDVSEFSSGRTNLFKSSFDTFLDHPLFGNGMFFNEFTTRAGSHNFIIDLLTQSGFVGMITFLIPVIFILKRAIRVRFQKEAMGWTLMFIALILHASGEVSLFNYSGDFMFWYTGGIIMSAFKYQ